MSELKSFCEIPMPKGMMSVWIKRTPKNPFKIFFQKEIKEDKEKKVITGMYDFADMRSWIEGIIKLRDGWKKLSKDPKALKTLNEYKAFKKKKAEMKRLKEKAKIRRLRRSHRISNIDFFEEPIRKKEQTLTDFEEFDEKEQETVENGQTLADFGEFDEEETNTVENEETSIDFEKFAEQGDNQTLTDFEESDEETPEETLNETSEDIESAERALIRALNEIAHSEVTEEEQIL